MPNIASQASEPLKSKVISYVLVIIACSIVTFAFHFYHVWQNSQRQQQILQTYERSINDNKKAYPVNRTRQMEDFVAASRVHYEEVKALLELEFNKIQGEYETQEIWTAILTIVFLIFSFYSMFKSEELERQGHEALKSIRDVEQRAKFAYDKIEREKSKKINSIQSQYTEWRKQRQIELAEELRKEKETLTQHVSSEQEKAEKTLSQKYMDVSSRFSQDLKNSYEQKIEEISESYKQTTDTFIEELKEKNLAEIQNQVKQWGNRLSEMMDNFERQIANALDELNTAQRNNSEFPTDVEMQQPHPEEVTTGEGVSGAISDADDVIDDDTIS